MTSSARAVQLRPTSFLKNLSILGLFIIVISYSYWSHLTNINSVFSHLKPTTTTPAQTQQQPGEKLELELEFANDHNWTQKIWQTSKYPAGNISTENEIYIKTWRDLNPGYQHNLLTDELIAGYMKEHFHARNPDIEETFLQAGDLDFVLKLDLIKYLVLWAEGGVYSDLDVACGKPVGEWVPERFMDKAGVVLGVGKEQKGGGDGGAGEEFGLVDWSIMAKPNQPFFWFVYQRFRENIKRLAAEEGVPGQRSRPYNVSDVTGRNALTQAFLAYATSVTATKVTGNNFTGVSEPTLFGEILVLPVQAFDSLVHHHEAGSWKSEPWDKLQLTGNEEQKMEEPEHIEVAEEEKNVEVEKQKQVDNLEEDEKVETSEEEETHPTGNSTSSADALTMDKVGQTSVNGTAEPSNPPEESNKASPADEKEPTSDKPPSVQYENAQSKDKPTTNDKPPSVQYENAKFAGNVTESKYNISDSASQQSINDNTTTKEAPNEDTETKIEEEIKAKEEAEKLKAQAAAEALEQEKEEAAAKEAAEAKELAEAQEKEEEEKNAAEAQKRKEEAEKRLAEEEEQKKKKAAEPKWAPLNEAGVLASSNNLADYGAEFVPTE